jgi:flagellar biosynthesis/type III secretory pathway protein FliH
MERDETPRRSSLLRKGSQAGDAWTPSVASGQAAPHARSSGSSRLEPGSPERGASARIPSSESEAYTSWEPGNELAPQEAFRTAPALTGRGAQLTALSHMIGLKELERPLHQLRKHDAQPVGEEHSWTLGELLLRESDAGSLPRRLRLTEESLRQGQAEAKRIRAEAEQVLLEAQAQADSVRDAAQVEGRRLAEEETHAQLLAVQAVLTETHAWRERMIADSENIVLELVRDMATALFSDGLALEDDVLRTAFARAMTEARAIGNLRIHVHPDDAMALGSEWWQQQQSMLGGQRVELVASETVKRGGCLIEGEFGSVDARVETQLKTAMQALQNGGVA